MRRYEVFTEVKIIRKYIVDANSEEEAIQNAKNGNFYDCENMDDIEEYWDEAFSNIDYEYESERL